MSEKNKNHQDDSELYDLRSSNRKIGDDGEEEIPVHTVEYMHDVPLTLVAEIGHCEMTIRQILGLRKNSVCEFSKVVGEPMDIIVGDRFMARGEIVVVNEHYGIRISEVTRAEEVNSDLANK